MPGLRLRGLLSHAGHGYLATSEDELRAIAEREAEMLRGSANAPLARGIAIEELSVGATPTLRFTAACARRTGSPSCGRATTCTSIARRWRWARRRSTTAR